MSIVIPGKSLKRDDDLEEFVTLSTREYYSKGRFSQAVCHDACMFVGRKVRDTMESHYGAPTLCHWTFTGLWQTSCGANFLVGPSTTTSYHYCPQCGGKITS